MCVQEKSNLPSQIWSRNHRWKHKHKELKDELKFPFVIGPFFSDYVCQEEIIFGWFQLHKEFV